jgi:hypothetical protein
MRTIKNNLLQRLAAQAEEAEVQGLPKVASALTEQISKATIRSDEAFYLYASSEFQADVEEKLWDIAVRAADFYDTRFDALEMQGIVEKYAQDLVHEIRTKLGIEHGIGAHEPTVPGEIAGKVVLEIDSEE